MRELSLVELEMIVGGYNEGFDTSAYAASDNGDGSYSATVSQAEYSANVGAASADGWQIDVTGGWSQTGGASISVKASKKS